MNKNELENMLVLLFPSFKESWKREDIHKDEDGSYTAHGLMSSFTYFYRANFSKFDTNVLAEFCRMIETVVASDPDDKSDVANAICTCFLEMIAGEPEGKRIEPFLGKACKEFYSHWI
jgi:hypothetical protein